MVHFIPFWSFRNNVLQEHKRKRIHRWAVISVWQHVGGKVHSGCRQNIKYVRLHILLCSGFSQERSVENSCHYWCWRHRRSAALRSPANISGISSDLATTLFFPPSLLHERNLRHLEKSFPDCPLEVGWAGLTVILGSQIPQEIWGLLSVAYNSSGLVYIGNYSETVIEVVQIHSLHKSVLTCKSAQAFMLYYLSKGDNWCEISKIKTPQPTRQKGNQALNRRYI